MGKLRFNPCRRFERCSNFTLRDIAGPLFSDSVISVFLPSNSTETPCSSINVSVHNFANRFEKLYTVDTFEKVDATCLFYTKNFNAPKEKLESLYTTYDNEGSAEEQLSLYVRIEGMPIGSMYNRVS